MNSELFTRPRNTTEHLEQTGASMDDSILMLCHSSKNIWSLLRTISIARDSFDKQLSGYNSAMSVARHLVGARNARPHGGKQRDNTQDDWAFPICDRPEQA